MILLLSCQTCGEIMTQDTSVINHKRKISRDYPRERKQWGFFPLTMTKLKNVRSPYFTASSLANDNNK